MSGSRPRRSDGPFTPDLYFGLGIVVSNGWYVQNPALNGYTGVMAYLPGRRLSVAIVSTQRIGASSEPSYASRLLEKLSAYLTPDDVPVLPE